MSKNTETIPVRRTTWTSDLPVAEVVARLDSVVHASTSEDKVWPILAEAKSKAEIDEQLDAIGGEGFNFLLFSKFSASTFLRTYQSTPDAEPVPDAHVYAIGNPRFGELVMRDSLLASLYVPRRLIVMGRTADPGSGTHIVYDELESIIVREGAGAGLVKKARLLDTKTEEVIQRVLLDGAKD
ncbi:hypothetical protein FA95DRAFT_1220159 [Auriscalpium vulgare]|uniref:Uncharacterized protein n=1 Tax=Auriscalpium vulgare TaxID=40419 RepID=A0ACB8RVF3_9AGAM|nr:hypothetical protein FA95DRAFT_1220159 [Auriscalpium vulgare]